MIGEPHEEREIQDFPDCVTHYYWIHEGTKDEDAWRALGDRDYVLYIKETEDD